MRIYDLFRDRIFTISNGLSLLRVVLLPLAVYLFIEENRTNNPKYICYEVALLAVIIATDFFDGFLARVLNQRSMLGRFLDPVADKICIITFAVCLYIFRNFPVWVMVVGLIREIVVVSSAYILFSQKDIEVKPNLLGKLCTATSSVVGLIYILNIEYSFCGYMLKETAAMGLVFLYVLSVAIYFCSYLKHYRN